MADSDDPFASRIGPVLYLRGGDGDGITLRAMCAVKAGAGPPALRVGGHPVPVAHEGRRAERDFHLADFVLPCEGGAYEVDGETFTVASDLTGDLRLAFVSCNGKEDGDLDRDMAERNAMWTRLRHDHDAAPFNLLLHGGDQVYADEAGRAHPLAVGWPDDLPGPLTESQKAEVRASLERAFTNHYLTLYAQPDFAHLAARVPSLAMWDDHDICDGWGSLEAATLDSDLGRILFDVARDAFLLFQLGAPDALPAICRDAEGRSLGWSLDLPDLRIAAPDLRSERRPDRIMGEAGWAATDAMLAAPAPERVLVMSSVPALGPRLSVVEAWMNSTPWMEDYEDDLRDQWQSRAHRAEWQRFLTLLSELQAQGATATVLSGEIHLATRATMTTPGGPLHQLVASGIAHPPPPRGYARMLGTLARFGEAPLDGQPIRLHPLPGQPRIYTDERNYLTLERRNGAWHAQWELEDSGPTAPLAI